jgi:hypothetical protein
MKTILWIAAICALCVPGLGSTPLGTDFTYQGQIKVSGVPLTGTADVTFSLWDAASGGGQVGSSVSVSGISVVNGLFRVTLDFGAAAFNGDARWLQLAVRSPAGSGGYTTLSPRHPLTVTPYALQTRGLFVDSSLNVGVGTSSPGYKLDVAGTVRATGLRSDTWVQGTDLYAINPSGWQCSSFWGSDSYGGVLDLWAGAGDSFGLTLRGNGAGGGGQILLYNAANAVSAEFDGENNGGGARLLLSNGSVATIDLMARAYGYGAQVNFKSSSGATRHQFTAENSEMKVFDSNGQTKVWLQAPTGGATLSLMNSSGATAIYLNASNGRTTTKSLEITGGSDLSEAFDVNSAEKSVQPGMVVCIDPGNPGRLVVSHKAYDRTVAGIVSGAGGVNPGMVMGQKDSTADGTHPVALTGRVYCYADASTGAIQPGDLLTTSDTPGHAMKVTDHSRAQGAILGKAMSSLPAGEQGLVLVLVTLQ